MPDIVVTVPMARWEDWLDEGDLPGDEWDGVSEYHWFARGPKPQIAAGQRVYIVAHGKVRGYAPLVAIDSVVSGRKRDRFSVVRIVTQPDGHAKYVHWFPQPLPEWWWPGSDYGLVRHGGAVAVTIPDAVRGFQGWRYRWWPLEREIPFPDWMLR
jgi:hypothetical protein